MEVLTVAAPDDTANGAASLREKLLAAQAAQPPATTAWDQPQSWDWDADPEPPVFLVGGLIEQGTITTLTADTGAGKSWTAHALAYSVATGSPFLGREVRSGVVMYVDEENPARIPRSRLRALGMTSEHRAGVAYYCRQGFTVGEPTTNRKLCEQIKATDATLLVIDTLMAATNVGEINSNDEVVKFYKAMRQVTEATGVTVLILHHERKPAQGQKSGTGFSSMGARQIAGQSDGHLTLQLKEKSVNDRDDGGLDYRTVLVLNDAKDRDGATVVPGGERIVIESRKDADRRLIEAAVFSEGPAKTESEALVDGLLDEIVAALDASPERTLKRGKLAEALNRKTDDGTFKAALAAGEASGRISRRSYGLWTTENAEPQI